MQQFEVVCLTETKCDDIEENKMVGFESFIMPTNLERLKYRGIHGICMFIKECISHHFTIIDNFVSETVLWIHFNKNVSGFAFILGTVYLPHEASGYHHEDINELLADDIITIKATHDVPIILLGDFNSRIGLKSDFNMNLNLRAYILSKIRYYFSLKSWLIGKIEQRWLY